jgi:hypothetical protein
LRRLKLVLLYLCMQTPADEIDNDLPQWQKDLIDERLAAYKKNPSDTLDWDLVAVEFDNEDEEA